MKRLLLSLALMMLCSRSIAAQESTTIHSSMVGPGSTIEINAQQPDENGLIIIPSEPNTSDDVWGAIVINVTDAPISHIGVHFEFEVDGQ